MAKNAFDFETSRGPNPLPSLLERLNKGWQSGNALDSRSSGSLSHKGSNPFPGAKLMV